jgi:hypothetical protein
VAGAKLNQHHPSDPLLKLEDLKEALLEASDTKQGASASFAACLHGHYLCPQHESSHAERPHPSADRIRISHKDGGAFAGMGDITGLLANFQCPFLKSIEA